MANDGSRGESYARLGPDDVALLTAQMASVTAAGLPLGSGLRATAEEMPRGRVSSALRAIAGAVEGGATLDEAIEAQRGQLPAHLRGLILIGTRSGRTTEVLGRFLEFVNIGRELRNRLWLTLAYPAVCLMVSFGVFVFLCVAVVGAFSAILRDFGVQLPWPTMALMYLASLMQTGWTRVLEAGIGIVVLFVAIRVLTSEAQRRALAGKIPVIGGVGRNASLAEFCHLLALLLESGLTLDEAVTLTGDGVNDATITGTCRSMRADLREGLSLWQAITRQPVFPVGLARVLRWAEGHSGLPGSLHTAGEMFEARARSQAVLAGTILGVLVLLSIVFSLFLMIFGLFLPIFTLISRLAG